ncbi:MAG TPA: amidohydrolase [Anaerolineae bacterium]|nr:amidohydrolase [Anaerolineae bacterium]HQK13945.1 amidohydrolase [Anaerolineae bacterium]
MNVKILQHPRIYTGDAHYPWARMMAVVDDRIVALDAEAEAWAAAPGALIEDVEGALVIPGLVDAHIHAMWYALSLRELNLRDLSRAALLEAVAARARELPPGAWIIGRGWDQSVWDDSRFPTAAELDRVAPAHPVALIAKNAHAWVVNSTALRAASITAATPDPPHGRIGRCADGSPDGMMFEEATRLVRAVIPPATLDEVVDALDEAQGHLLACGITGIHDVDAEPAFAAFQELRRRERLRVRVVKYVRLESLDAALTVGLRSGYGDDWLRFGGLKLFADGALGARTGAMFAPYEGEPDNVGLLTLTPDDLTAITRQAAAGGLALAIHAIGDRANALVLDALEAVRNINPALRHRVEHVQHIRPEDQARLGRAGFVASMQPIHAVHDMVMVERHLGPQRAPQAYPWRSIADAGAVLAFGSDAPIEIFDPFIGLYAAVTRRREDNGFPGPEGWHPEQRLTLEEALRAYTWGAAYAAGLESRIGLLTPGHLADLAVLDQDIFTLPPEALLQTRALRVMVGGHWCTF